MGTGEYWSLQTTKNIALIKQSKVSLALAHQHCLICDHI
jgi:hypothetical protein